MKLRLLALSSCVALLASACSGGGSPGANQSSAANAANVAAPPAAAQASPELLTRIVDCSASFEAVGNLFGAIAETKTGAERGELMQTADQRRRLAEALRARAVAVGGGIGVPQADVEARLATAKERLLAESRAGDFAEFAGRMGRQADQCTRGMSEMM